MIRASSTDNVSAMNDSNPTPSISTIHSRDGSEREGASENDPELCRFLKMSALLALLIQGALPLTEFVTFTGLPPEAASDQLSTMINLSVVVRPRSSLHGVDIALPIWFAQEIFPALH